MIHGRRATVDAVLGVIDGARAGHGGAVTIVGEGGIGKTAVLNEVARQVAAWARVIRLTGVEAEVELGWSGLAGVVEGLLGGLERLAPARAAALRTALALDTGEEPVDPFGVALATRDLLVEAAEAEPIVVIVDDLHWVDPSTRRTLAYIARRLEVERLAIVSARRPGGDGMDTGAAVTLDALADEDADELLAELGVGRAEVRRQLIDASGGIPLVLVEAVNVLDDDQRAGRAELPDPLPIGPSGQRAVDLVLQRLPSAALRALVTAASEPSGDLRRILGALEQQGLGLAELEQAEAGGVIVLDGDALSFRHPLMRSAAYYDAPRGDRRAAHRALAATMPPGSLERAWHLARAAVAPDEPVAEILDDAAAEALRRGSPSTAARTWEQASRLSLRARDRLRRLRLAAAALIDAGSSAAAGDLLDRADHIAGEHRGDEPLTERIQRQRLRLRLPASSGGRVESGASLRALAREVHDAAPDLAVDLLIDALAADIRSGAFAGMVASVEVAGTLRDEVDADRRRRIDVIEGGLMVARGDASGYPLLDRYLEMLGDGRSPANALFLTEVVAPSLGFLHRTEQSDALLAELDADLRARGMVRPLVAVLGAQAMAQYGRSFPAALAAATDAVELAADAPEQASVAAGVLALGGAVVGDRTLCETAVRVLQDVPEPERRVFGPTGWAYLAYHEGRFAEAVALYEPIADLLPIGRGLLRWEIEWIESLIRIGRRADAAELIEVLEDTLPAAVMHQTGIDRAKGLLAEDDDEALTCFARAVAVGEAMGNDFIVGRAETVWGERLRRMRRRSESRVHLERAVDLLRAVGATLVATRAAAELQAAGGVVTGGAASHELLTPHELQIAKLVVAGASNRDLAQRLFISPRTVESHLTTIFRKLGVRNRRELAARALEDPGLQP